MFNSKIILQCYETDLSNKIEMYIHIRWIQYEKISRLKVSDYEQTLKATLDLYS